MPDGSCDVQISAVAHDHGECHESDGKSAPPKTGQNAAPGGISRPPLALGGTTWHKPRALDLVGGGTPPRFPPARCTSSDLLGPVRGRRRYANIGSADAMTIPEARREARRLIASYIEPAKKDSGLRTPGYPMTAFAEEFLARQAHRWKPRTVETNSRIVRKDILPAFGDLTVDAITVEQVRDWFAAMSARLGIANRAMPVLSMMMRMAELWGYRRHNSNPCTKTRRYRMKPMERFLTADEMARLNAVLTRDEFWCPQCRRHRPPADAGRQRLAATPHPLFLQRTLVSRKRAKIGARAGPIWHYVALRGTRGPLHVRVHARSKDLWDRHVVPSSPAPARRPRTTSGSASYSGRQRTVKTSRIGR